MGSRERLRLEYRRKKFSSKSRVKRFFRYLKEKVVVFYHKLSVREHIQGIMNLKLFPRIFKGLNTLKPLRFLLSIYYEIDNYVIYCMV
jgi:hypothetical protein